MQKKSENYEHLWVGFFFEKYHVIEFIYCLVVRINDSLGEF